METIDKDKCAPEGTEKQQQREFLLSLKETFRKVQTLPDADKADVLDLALDIINDLPGVLNQPERLKDTLLLITEIAHQKREDVALVDMPATHEKPISSDNVLQSEMHGKPERLQKWVNWVAHQVKVQREKRGWTQEQLAKKTGLPQSHISRIENRKHSPSRKTLERLAKAFKMPIEDFDCRQAYWQD